jgi:hypothetical protein
MQCRASLPPKIKKHEHRARNCCIHGCVNAALHSLRECSLPICVWMFIGGFGLAKEKDRALGVSFVRFTVILANSAVGTIEFVYDSIKASLAWYTEWATWVAIILVAFSAIGFLYLLATHKRYH